MEKTKQNHLLLVEQMMQQNVLSYVDLRPYSKELARADHPVALRDELENWYRIAGVELITGRPFHLSDCPFSEDEIKEAKNNNNTILCVPAGITKQQLGQLFHLDNWALHDPLVTSAMEKEDCWMKTSLSPVPGFIKQTGVAVCRQI